MVAGLIWSYAGVILLRLAFDWLSRVNLSVEIILAFGGFLLSLLIFSYGFSKVADKNIQRIEEYASNRVCIFAFQEWTSYPLVAFMISLGIVLRKYSPIPKPLLAIAYIGIGGSLFLASFRYYRHFFYRS